MTSPPLGTTSFHAGEVAAQERAGTRGVAEELGTGIRTSLNFASNHDAFLAAQMFAVVSSVHKQDGNGNGQIWVTPLFGKPGDMTALSESEILISPNAIPKSDILHEAMKTNGVPLSMLGIDLLKRTRHRINGVAVASSPAAKETSSNDGLHFQVNEYSPNCPKYINRREIIPSDTPINLNAVREERTELTEQDCDFVQSMDTLWIGSCAPGVGADVNHRGGKPGFIRVTSNTTVEWPEYRGNGTFFTSGNLEVNSCAGLTLVDFDTGSMMQLTGQATVDWQHDGTYEGATRVIQFQIQSLVRTNHVTNHRWTLLDYSPYNPNIAGSSNNQGAGHDYPTTVTLAKIVTETPNVKTFRWVAQRQIPFLPGQYATFEFEGVFGGGRLEVRTWTLSETPNSIHGDNTLDITVKRAGLVTHWLHDHAKVGLEIKLNGVQGEMTAVTFDPNTKKATVPRHLLLVSAGIGITPNLAMVRGIGAFELQNDTNITMIHVERKEEDLICQSELLRRVRNYPNFTYTNVITSKEGRLNLDKLRQLMPIKKDDATVVTALQQQTYLCGPTKFMTDMTEHLVALGVPAANIHTESFDF